MSSLISENRFLLANFLKLESLGEAMLLSGHANRELPVERATVVEDANLAFWTEPGDVLLSSGYPFWKEPSLLANLLPGLQKKGVVALCLKPERVASAIPLVVLQAALDIGFPIVQLPATAVFSSIVYECRDMLLRIREVEFRQTQAQAQKLLDRLLTTTPTEKCLSVVEETIGGNPVIALSSDNELILSQNSRALLLGNVQDDLIRQLNQSALGDTVMLRIYDEVRPVKAHFYSFSGRRGCSILVLECYRPLQETELEILHRVNPVLSLEINSAVAIKKVRRKYKDRFVKNLIAGTLGTEADMCTVAEAQGYLVEPGQLYRVVIARLHAEDAASITEKDLGGVNHLAQSFGYIVAFTLLDRRLVLIFRDEGDPVDAAEVHAFQTRLKNILRTEGISLCVSEPYSLPDIPAAYLESRRICEIGAQCGAADAVVTYDQLGVSALLALLPNNRAVRSFRERMLGPLKDYDVAHGTALLETLEVYLSTRCNAKRTAERLFTHYNTVIYRIDRIQSICEIDLDDAEQILRLQIALKMDMIQADA